MTRDEIIRMAQEAGATVSSFHGRFVMYPDDIDRFAALVAAAEREACMKAADAVDDEGSHNQRTMKRRIRAAIRARGQK